MKNLKWKTWILFFLENSFSLVLIRKRDGILFNLNIRQRIVWIYFLACFLGKTESLTQFRPLIKEKSVDWCQLQSQIKNKRKGENSNCQRFFFLLIFKKILLEKNLWIFPSGIKNKKSFFNFNIFLQNIQIFFAKGWNFRDKLLTQTTFLRRIFSTFWKRLFISWWEKSFMSYF